jgi:hypothetical protein
MSSDQLRSEGEVAAAEKKAKITMSRETEQRLIRDFYSPLPADPVKRSESVLLQKAAWTDRRR